MLILSLTPHRGMFIILTVISSSSPVWLRPAKAWNSMMWAFRPSRLSKFALLWEWWWSISSIYPYFIRYICNKSTAIEKRKPQKISYENWMVWIFTNDLWDDTLWYLWLNRNIKTCLWVKEKSPDDATLKALFAYSISFLKASVGFCGLFLRKTRSLKGLKEFRNKNCTILLLHIFWTHIFVSK